MEKKVTIMVIIVVLLSGVLILPQAGATHLVTSRTGTVENLEYQLDPDGSYSGSFDILEDIFGSTHFEFIGYSYQAVQNLIHAQNSNTCTTVNFFTVYIEPWGYINFIKSISFAFDVCHPDHLWTSFWYDLKDPWAIINREMSMQQLDSILGLN
jgi:hypothetical protein